MAPGGKKKHSKQELNYSERPNHSKDKKVYISNSEAKSQSSTDIAEQCTKDHSKYTKRNISSNWKRYEESDESPFTDTMRGGDFATLVQASGGLQSQLKLQDEKEWDEVEEECEKFLAIDIKDIVASLQCIPLHKRLNLPEDIFTEDQIDHFNAVAAQNKQSIDLDIDNYTNKHVESDLSEDQALFFVESQASKIDPEHLPKKSVILEEKTENIIDSLTSCLTLKETPTSYCEEKKDEISDDLNMLLSLNSSSEVKTAKTINVDDWLNSILDD